MYPYNDPMWNERDQDYLCRMAGYGYPVTRIREPFRYIVENGKCSTYKPEYQAYLDSLKQTSAPSEATTTEGVTETTPDTTDSTTTEPSAGGDATDPSQETT